MNNILGSYSGIGMETIDQLIEAEKSKGVQFTNKKTKIEKQQTAWKDVSTRLDSLYKKIDKLQNPETFKAQTIKSSIKDSTFLSVTGNRNAAVGQYRMEVKQLASASRLTGDHVAIPTLTEEDKEKGITSIDKDLEIEGSFSFISHHGIEEDPTKPTEITEISIKLGDSLKDIAEKINVETKESGVKASIVDNRLILTDTEMGTRNISVTSQGEVTDSLGFSTGGELKEGRNAIVEIDGLAIERSSNKINDAIEGLTINLTNKHETGKTELITVEQDTGKMVDAVKEFVDQYNSVMSFIKEQTDFGDPSLEDNKSGALAGESSIIRLQSGLRSLLTKNLEGTSDGDFKNLSELGIEIDRYGVAKIDQAKLNEVVLEDPANVAKFFYQPELPGVVDEAGDVGAKTPKAGMSELLKNFVDSYTSSKKGIVKTTQESYDRMLKDINKQIETFNGRIDRKRDRYIREFTALDQAMMQAESQLEYLYSQMGMD